VSNPLFLNTVLLGGTTGEKIAAAGAAGFGQVELWREDLDDCPASAVRGALEEHGVGLADFQVLRDFAGAPGDMREAKAVEALAYLSDARAVGATTLLVPAATHLRAVPYRAARDLAWLADRAAQFGMRVAYEALSWSTWDSTTAAAWATVREADRDNLGLALDSFHHFVRGGSIADLTALDPERIFCVQISDLRHQVSREDLIGVARHHRRLPGDGYFPLDGFVGTLLQAGYTGPLGLEVFSDELRAGDPATTAGKAMAALRGTLAAAGEGVAWAGGDPVAWHNAVSYRGAVPA
jgi:4-hydroxyphenylpyruvate dioxygenase